MMISFDAVAGKGELPFDPVHAGENVLAFGRCQPANTWFQPRQ